VIDTLHIVVAMKPFGGSFADNVLEYGVAGLNIDESRIGMDDRLGGGVGGLLSNVRDGREWGVHAGSGENGYAPSSQGRWPANVILDDSEVVGKQFPETGKSSGGSRGAGGQHGRYSKIGAQPDFKPGFGDSGSAARFFKRVSET